MTETQAHAERAERTAERLEALGVIVKENAEETGAASGRLQDQVDQAQEAADRSHREILSEVSTVRAAAERAERTAESASVAAQTMTISGQVVELLSGETTELSRRLDTLEHRVVFGSAPPTPAPAAPTPPISARNGTPMKANHEFGNRVRL